MTQGCLRQMGGSGGSQGPLGRAHWRGWGTGPQRLRPTQRGGSEDKHAHLRVCGAQRKAPVMTRSKSEGVILGETLTSVASQEQTTEAREARTEEGAAQSQQNALQHRRPSQGRWLLPLGPGSLQAGRRAEGRGPRGAAGGHQGAPQTNTAPRGVATAQLT